MPPSGADLAVQSLAAAGVTRLFTLSGNQILSIYDATIGRDIELIHTRHEAAAVHMADAWGRLTNMPGVALLTAGPGHCNALSALYVALMAESPVLLLSGHCPHAQIGTGAFQEIAQVTAAEPVTKASWLATDTDRLGDEIAVALAIACDGRPGPVHLSLPADILEAVVSGQPGTVAAPDLPHRPDCPEDAALHAVLDRCAAATRPLILAGPAMSRRPSWQDVQRLSEVTGMPALPMESPRGVNDPWLHGATNCLSEADLVLLTGKRLDFSLQFGRPPFFNETCRFIQIDADEEALCRDTRVVHRLHADPVQTIRRLTDIARAGQRPHTLWSDRVAAARQTVPDTWPDIGQSSMAPIHPLRVCEALQPFLDDDGIMVSDGGEFGQWAQAGLEAPIRVINGPAGAIGGSIPMAIAAKAAHPDRSVFVTIGDGAFGYHAMEFDTALRHGLPIVAVVGNDARWNAEHQLQLHHYGRTVGCDLLPSRYDTVVTALGGYGEEVRHPDNLEPALERALASGLPACINVAIEGAAAPMFR